MKDLMKNLKFAWHYAKNTKKYIYILGLCNIVSIVLSILTPIISAKIIIELTQNDYQRILLLALIIFFMDYVADFLHYIARRCSIKVYRKTLSLIAIDLGSNILKLENNCLDKNSSGVFIQRMTGDTSRLADVFNNVLGLSGEIIKYIGIFIALFIVNKIMFIYMLIVLSVLYFMELKRTKQYNKDDKIYRKKTEKLSGFTGELVRGARDIKMLNSEEDFINELEAKIDDANGQRFIMQKRSWLYKLIMWQSSDLSVFLTIVLLVTLMSKGFIIPATALILYNYSNRLYGAVYIIGNLLDFVKDFNLSSERIYNIIYSDDFKKEEFGKIHLEEVKGNFEFKNVKFGYEDKKVLNNINLKINAKETVAIVGKSGAGKTTIFNLINKMYKVDSGELLIDGINVNDLDKETIRGNITTISQNPYIFNMSIKDNLRLVKKDLTDKKMREVCKIACLDDFIKSLPDGYDSIIGEGGVNLSGGQKQRLAIARALVQNTKIILFDEATSALDNETQEKIQKAIENMKNEYTILIIAHRLSTIINADRILYLENGKILAEGKHEELLKKCKEYRDLYETELNKEK